MGVWDIPRGVDEERRIVFQERISEDKYDTQVFDALESASLTRSLLCNEGEIPFKFRLLRVMNMVDVMNKVNTDCSLDGIFKQVVNLRYIWTSNPWSFIIDTFVEIPSSISLLWNLQTLFIAHPRRFVAAPEIWDITQLRHVNFYEICLPKPPWSDQQDDDFVLRNLQTLKKVLNFRLSEEVCKRIPNVKKLNIGYRDVSGSLSRYCLYNLGRLHKLESLNCHFHQGPNRDDLLQNLKFPTSLKKLSLTYCNLQWEDLTMIGLLPHIEFLKLSNGAVGGSEWNPVEGEFVRLKYLEIVDCEDLRYWNADSSHFPVLEEVFLEGFSELDEIPLAIGEIPTLRVIDMTLCSESAAVPAMIILEEQESGGNEDFQVRLKFFDKTKLNRFKEKVEQFDSFTSNNLQHNVMFTFEKNAEGLLTASFSMLTD